MSRQNPLEQSTYHLFNSKVWNSLKQGKRLRSLAGVSSMVAIFLLVFITNQSHKISFSLEQASSVAPRGIASTQTVESNEFYSQWKKKIAEQIAETSEIPSGKMSRQPNPLEKLVFGELKGYYLLHMEGMKIKEMLLEQKYKTDEIPQYFGSELSFLNSHKNLWWLNYHSLIMKEKKKGESIISLLDSSNKIVGEASFLWDDAGRMTSLKIEKK